MRKIMSVVCVAALGLGSAAEAQRSTQDGALAATYGALDARRFPTPRAASLARAQRLGLGGADVARELLHRAPPDALVRAAGTRNATTPTLRWPVDDGRYGRGFGYVRATDRKRRHDGVDVVAPRGSVVRAVEAGLVAYSGDGVRGFGNCLVLVHPNGWVSVYAHNDRLTVPTGYRVRRGERIAFVGSTGISQGPHLHFELIVEGEAVNPMPYFHGRPWIEARARWDAGELAHRRDHLGALAPDYSAEDEYGEQRLAARPTQTQTATPTPTVTPTATPTPSPDAALREARALLSSPASAAMLASVPGRQFGTVLWPLRSPRIELVGAPAHAELAIRGEASSAVRAVADGRVVYVGGGLDGRGLSVVLVHPNGWVSVYAGLGEATATAGDAVMRGEWIGKLGRDSAPLRFELRDGGRAIDPRPLLVQAPEGVALSASASGSPSGAQRP